MQIHLKLADKINVRYIFYLSHSAIFIVCYLITYQYAHNLINLPC